jgi:hypothetical protein
VITTDRLVDTEEVDAVKVADEEPAGTATEAGTLTVVLLEEIPTDAPPDGAGPESVTVQVLLLPPATVAGAQLGILNTRDVELMLIDVVTVAPPELALTVAVMVGALVEAVTVKFADTAPAATVTLAGLVRKSDEPLRVTTAPPAGAAEASVTTHAVEAPGTIVVGLQLRDETGGPDDPPPVPPAAASASELPVAFTPKVWLKLVAIAVVPDVRLKVTEATTPFAMMFEFIPLTTHVYSPEFVVH